MAIADRTSRITLGSYILDLDGDVLLKGGEPVRLRRKAHLLLAYLARSRGRVVSKDELLSTIWPGLHVTEDSLTQAVREIRRTLGDDGRHLLRTVSGRGYVIPHPIAVSSKLTPRLLVAAFEVAAGDAESSRLAERCAAGLRDRLARFASLQVLSSGGVSGDTADYKMTGRVSRESDMTALHAELTAAPSGPVLWNQDYTLTAGSGGDNLSELCLSIVNRVAARVADAELKWALARPDGGLGAGEHLLRGIAWLRGYRRDDNLEARRCFEAAIGLDPDLGLAHSYLGLAELIIGGYAKASTATFTSSIVKASIGVTLAPEDPRSHRILGLIRLFARQHDAAEMHVSRSIELNPHDADTLIQMGFVKTMRGRPQEGLALMEQAMRINAVHPDYYHFDRAMALYSAGLYRESIVALGRLPLGEPKRWTRIAAAYAQLGEMEEARRNIALALDADPAFDPMDYAQSGVPFEHPADVDRLVEGVGKAIAG